MTEEVLVVDDQPGIRMLLTDILRNDGYQVSEATTGKEALKKINSHSFDLIILDYKLPIIDGAGVLQKLKQSKIDIPVILMSGLVDEISMDSKKYPMVKKIMEKPFNVLDIQHSVKLILG